ncbi:hypothetical protein GC194_07985 [bacterium]|nr:hypothetical protein [bacterium]
MNFLYPGFLYALGLVAIPVIIHIFNFRRFKKQEFTQVKFLEKATKVRRRFRQLRDIIIMLLRMAAIACLVLAFAHPVPDEYANQSQESSLVSVYIDNSFSMELEGANGELLNLATKRAEEIAESFGEETLFQLLTNDIDNNSTDFVSRELFLQNLENLQPGPRVIPLSEINEVQQSNLLQHSGNRIQVIITDFQKRNFPIDEFKSDSLINTFWIPVQSENVANLSVDSAWFEQAAFVKGQTARLMVKITNYGIDEVNERAVYATVNGVQRAMQTINLLPGESQEIELFFAVANDFWNDVHVSIEDYPIEFDNNFYTSFYVKPSRQVLQVYGKQPNEYIKKVYEKSDNFLLSQVQLGLLDANQLSDFDLVILDELTDIGSGLGSELAEFVNNGGNLLLIPAFEMQTDGVNAFTAQFGVQYRGVSQDETSVKSLDLNNHFFDDIFEGVPGNTDFPHVFYHYQSAPGGRSLARSIIQLSNGDAFLYETNLGIGRAFIATAPFDQKATGLVKNGIFLPLLYKFASYKGSQVSNGFFIDQVPSEAIVGKDVSGIVPGLFGQGVSMVPNYVLKNGRITIFEDEIMKDGFYEIKEMQKPDSSYLHLGFNFNRNESEFSFWTLNDLEQQAKLKNVQLVEGNTQYVSGVFKDLSDKNRFWQYFLLAAFCFLLFEIIAIKLPFK